ncbi:MAG: hypothetical protein LBJ44_01420 [Propionibacteriaceae bacterium]|jgi:hypothetical protein|nr:hypothetical protein [Propionibacteriaceae bacterium]
MEKRSARPRHTILGVASAIALSLASLSACGSSVPNLMLGDWLCDAGGYNFFDYPDLSNSTGDVGDMELSFHDKEYRVQGTASPSWDGGSSATFPYTFKPLSRDSSGFQEYAVTFEAQQNDGPTVETVKVFMRVGVNDWGELILTDPELLERSAEAIDPDHTFDWMKDSYESGTSRLAYDLTFIVCTRA